MSAKLYAVAYRYEHQRRMLFHPGCSALHLSSGRELSAVVTFPLKTTPSTRKLDCAVMGRNEEAHDSKTAYGGADHRRVEGCPVWGQCSGPVRKHGNSDATFYKWRTKYAGLEVSDVKKLCQLEDENRRLKQMVAEQALDIQALKAITAKKLEGPRRNGQPPR